MIDHNYQTAEKIFPTDRFLKHLILWLIPSHITPNHITLLRFLATPVVWGFLWQEQYAIGLIAFLFVSFTDALDGALARTRNQITRWGMVYDPLADKLLIGGVLMVLIFRFLAFYIGLMVIGLEVLIIVVAYFWKRQGKKVEANRWGKIKMILQVTGITLILLAILFNTPMLILVASYIFYAAIGFAIASMVTYGI